MIAERQPTTANKSINALGDLMGMECEFGDDSGSDYTSEADFLEHVDHFSSDFGVDEGSDEYGLEEETPVDPESSAEECC